MTGTSTPNQARLHKHQTPRAASKDFSAQLSLCCKLVRRFANYAPSKRALMNGKVVFRASTLSAFIAPRSFRGLDQTLAGICQSFLSGTRTRAPLLLKQVVGMLAADDRP